VLNVNRPFGYFAVNKMAKKAMIHTTIKANHRNTRRMTWGSTSNHFRSHQPRPGGAVNSPLTDTG